MRWSILILTMFTSLFASAIALDQAGRGPDPEGRFDAVIVLGCRVRPDGTPSDALARRADKAVQLWQAGVAPVVLFTGGKGDYGEAEAEVAAAHAASRGLAEVATRLETRSASTEQNAAFAAEILPGANVVIVTDRYHTVRATRVFERYFPKVEAVGVRTPGWARGALREVGALLYYGVSGRL